MEEVLSALRTALNDPDPRVRQQAARAIGYLGPAGAEAAPDLVALMARGADTREAACALQEIGAAAVPHLVALLEAGEELRRTAAEALQLIARGGM